MTRSLTLATILVGCSDSRMAPKTPMAISRQSARSGVAHGLSNALYEEAVYDDQGQSLASTFLDYPLPTAREMPRVELFHLTTPSPINPLGVKGAGEAGTLPVPAAVANAVEDALRRFGTRVNRLPLSPARISDLIHGA